MKRFGVAACHVPALVISVAFASAALAFAPSVRAQTGGSAPGRASLAPARAAAAAPRAAAGHVGAEIRKLSEAFADVADKIGPSVVQIEVTSGVQGSPLQWFRGDGIKRGMGSGVVLSRDGAILTNNHVIEDARSITVRLRDGRVLAGRVVGRDPATDLAVLHVDAKDLVPAPFADSDAARVGEWVLAIGSPFGLDYTITTGVLSAKGRGGVGINAVEDYLQTDASINPGNSGGPLVDLDGNVLGINTMVVSRGQGIGLAVPSRMARRVADQILKTGRVDRAWIGVGLQDLTPALAAEIPNAPPAGALVNAVAPGGPAAKAHLVPGDVIAALAGKPVRDAQDVIREVFAHDVDDTVVLEVVRGGKHYQTAVKLASRHDPPPPALPMQQQRPPQAGLGLRLRDVQDPEVGRDARVAQVFDVMTGSAADQAGLRPGDVVLDADATHAPSAEQVEAEARDGHVLLRVRRGRATFYTSIRR